MKLEHRLAALGMVAVASVVAAACGGAGNESPAPAPGASTDEAGVVRDPAPDAADAPPPFAPAHHRPWPQLVLPAGDGGSHVLSPMKLVTIVAANDDLSSKLFAFSDALIASAWWVVSRATPEGDESILDELTERASHEIIEAATDTSRGWHLPRSSATPWSDADASIWRSIQPGTVENGDLCELSRIREPVATGFLFQRSWSNKAALLDGDPCVPARTEPYFNVSVAKDSFMCPRGAAAAPRAAT